MIDDDVNDHDEDNTAGAEGADGEESFEEYDQKRLSGKKIVLFVVLPLLIIIGGGVGLYFSGALDSLLGKQEEEHVAASSEDYEGAAYEFSDTPGHFYEMPDIIVNLNNAGRKQRFLKLNVSLELDKAEDVPALEAVMPRVNDHFQTYLRELRMEDLEGSSGIYRLRQELLERVRTAAYPIKVRDVLFSEVLVQ